MTSEVSRSSPVPSRRRGRSSPDVKRARPTFVPGSAPSFDSAAAAAAAAAVVAVAAAVFASNIVVGSVG